MDPITVPSVGFNCIVLHGLLIIRHRLRYVHAVACSLVMTILHWTQVIAKISENHGEINGSKEV